MIKLLTYLFILFSVVNSFAQTKSDSIKNDFKQSIILNHQLQQKQLANQILKQYSTHTILYYKTLLTSVPNNSVLITNGINDTYPLIALQYAKQLNSHTKIVSLKLLLNQQYKQLIEKQLSVQLSTNHQKNIKTLMTKYKIYISSTVNYNYYKAKSNQLFLTGLVLENNGSNQFEKLNKFWNNFKLKGILNLSLSSKEKQLFSNFLPPLLTLYKLYVINDYNAKQLKQDILKFAKQINQEEKVKQIIKKYE